MRWDICEKMGWTFDEFDETSAEELMTALAYEAVRAEIQKAQREAKSS